MEKMKPHRPKNRRRNRSWPPQRSWHMLRV